MRAQNAIVSIKTASRGRTQGSSSRRSAYSSPLRVRGLDHSPSIVITLPELDEIRVAVIAFKGADY